LQRNFHVTLKKCPYSKPRTHRQGKNSSFKSRRTLRSGLKNPEEEMHRREELESKEQSSNHQEQLAI
jgi:hypothetical protein